MTGDLSAAWSKLEEYAARLALVIHFIRWAAGDRELADAGILDIVNMKSGIVLTAWFKHEARRVYGMLGESNEDRDSRQLVEWIECKGGSVTARDVQRGCRWLKEPDAPDAALEELVKAVHGSWQDAPTTGNGSRPTRVFVPSTVSASTL